MLWLSVLTFSPKDVLYIPYSIAATQILSGINSCKQDTADTTIYRYQVMEGKDKPHCGRIEPLTMWGVSTCAAVAEGTPALCQSSQPWCSGHAAYSGQWDPLAGF